MKFLSYLIFAVAFLSLVSCSGDKSSDTSREPLTTTPTTQTPSDNSAITSTNSNEPHYKCPNDCEGSGGATSGTCPVCGTAYVHNQAYHNQPNQQTNPIQLENPTPPAGITPPSTPGQNAAGVWHYICSNGCAGGAGSAGSCATCGSALTHNQAYH